MDPLLQLKSLKFTPNFSNKGLQNYGALMATKTNPTKYIEEQEMKEKTKPYK